MSALFVCFVRLLLFRYTVYRVYPHNVNQLKYLADLGNSDADGVSSLSYEIIFELPFVDVFLFNFIFSFSFYVCPPF